MNTSFSQEFTHYHQADMRRQADAHRLAKLAAGGRSHFAPAPKWGGDRRLILALGGAVAIVLATASAVLAG